MEKGLKIQSFVHPTVAYLSDQNDFARDTKSSQWVIAYLRLFLLEFNDYFSNSWDLLLYHKNFKILTEYLFIQFSK